MVGARSGDPHHPNAAFAHPVQELEDHARPSEVVAWSVGDVNMRSTSKSSVDPTPSKSGASGKYFGAKNPTRQLSKAPGALSALQSGLNFVCIKHFTWSGDTCVGESRVGVGSVAIRFVVATVPSDVGANDASVGPSAERVECLVPSLPFCRRRRSR